MATSPVKLQYLEDGFHGIQSPSPMLESPEMEKSLSASDALKALRHDRQLARAVLRVPLPLLYFIAYIFALISHIPTSYLFKQNNALSTTLATSGSTTVSDASPMLFYNIGQMSDVFDWLEKTLAPNIFVTQDYNSNDLPSDQWGRIALHNQVLGAVQFTVISGVAESCDNQKFLHSIYPNCYNDEVKMENTTLLSVTLNKTDAVDYIKALQESGTWLDESTEKLEITVVTYNGEINTYGVTTLTLNFQEGGFIDLSSESIGAVSSAYREARPYVVDSLLFVCFVLVLGNQLTRLWKHRRGLLMHLKSFWLFVDYATTVLVVAFYVVWGVIVNITRESSFRTNIQAFSATNVDWTADETAADNLSGIVSSLKRIGHLTTALRLIATVTILFLGIRILDTFRFHPRLNVLSHTISSSLHKFGSFLVVFTIVVVTFSLSGHFIFGDRAKEFHTIKASLESCINILFGNFDYSAIQSLIVPVSIIYYWTYLIVSNLILLNMMLAIVLDTYDEVAEEAFNDKTITSMGRIVYIAIYDVLLWFHDLPTYGCFQKNKHLRADELDSRELSRRQIIFRGKIRPDVLEVVFDALNASESKRDLTAPPLKLTSLKLQSLFSGAQVSDEESRKTIDYLLHGLLPLIDGGEDKNEEPKLSKKQRKKANRGGGGDLVELSLPLDQGGNGPWESFANNEVQQLSERMTALERKLELILDHIAKK